jgi:hypothetical protein
MASSIPPAWLGPHGRYLLARRALLEPYVERRIPLFAVRYGTKLPVGKWRDTALQNKIDEVALTQDTNVAAVCGELSDLDVFDIEAPHVERFLAYCDRSGLRPVLDRVPRIRTWSGGVHWYFQHAHGQQTRDLWIDGVKVGQIKAGATTTNGKLLVSYVLVPPSVIVKDDRRGNYAFEVSLRDGLWTDFPPALAAIIGKDRDKTDENEESENRERGEPASALIKQPLIIDLPPGLYRWPATDDPDEAVARMRGCVVESAFAPVTRATDRSAVIYGTICEAISVGASRIAIYRLVEQMPSKTKVEECAATGDARYLDRTILSAVRRLKNLHTTLVTVNESRAYTHTVGSLRRIWIRAFDAAGNHYHADVNALDAAGNPTGDWAQLCASLWSFAKTRRLAENLRERPDSTLLPQGTPLRVDSAPTESSAWTSYRVFRFVPV